MILSLSDWAYCYPAVSPSSVSKHGLMRSSSMLAQKQLTWYLATRTIWKTRASAPLTCSRGLVSHRRTVSRRCGNSRSSSLACVQSVYSRRGLRDLGPTLRQHLPSSPKQSYTKLTLERFQKSRWARRKKSVAMIQLIWVCQSMHCAVISNPAALTAEKADCEKVKTKSFD